MSSMVFVKTTGKGMHSFYLTDGGCEYYLFSQDYRKSVKEFYSSPISLDRALDFSFGFNSAIRRTMEKLRVYIPYIEKEYGISVLRKTKKAKRSDRGGRRALEFEVA